MPWITFSADVQLTRRGDYYLCTHNKTRAQVIIAARLKEIIEQQQWVRCAPEDQEEIRSLRELGFLVEVEP
ncbi:MAG TPA: hypothetical protein VKV19_03305 [Ktedonobacteraceae bacterium]|jgi:hypothetical protein|nr:hypothetical protein [Ktedonobacteraceae bacterium]